MRLAVLYSGGKDSTYALHLATLAGHEICHLVTIVPQRSDSWMFHTVNLHVVPLLSEAIGIPLVQAESSGVKQDEVNDLKRAVEDLEVDGLVSGAIASTYQKSRIEDVCRELGLKSFTPLWQRSSIELLREMIASGMTIIVTSVSALGLGIEWLGRTLDCEAVKELVVLGQKFGVDVCGEGGEMDTLVVDAPFYNRRLQIVSSRIEWSDGAGRLHIKARLGPKVTRP